MAHSTLVVVKLLDTPHKRIYIFYFFKKRDEGTRIWAQLFFVGRTSWKKRLLEAAWPMFEATSNPRRHPWCLHLGKPELFGNRKWWNINSLPFRSPASRTRAAGWKINRLQGWVNAETNSRQTRRCKNHSWLPAYGGRNVKKLCLSTVLCFRSLQNYFPR